MPLDGYRGAVYLCVCVNTGLLVCVCAVSSLCPVSFCLLDCFQSADLHLSWFSSRKPRNFWFSVFFFPADHRRRMVYAISGRKVA